MRGLSIAIFFISVIFSILAAIMAFCITYKEYARHYLDKRDVLKAALRTCGFTFTFFLALGLLLAMTLPLLLN
jgi:threonine/homoserine/homoserine lactone efflux protein